MRAAFQRPIFLPRLAAPWTNRFCPDCTVGLSKDPGRDASPYLRSRRGACCPIIPYCVLPGLVKCEAVPAQGRLPRRRRCMRMTSRPELRQQYDIISSFQPALHLPQNWNYENPAPLFRAYMHPPHDVGGQQDVPVHYEEKEEEQWELNTYVTCEVLGWRGVWTAEERRRRADNDLGYTLYLGMPYYGRWIWSAARMLVDKKHISLTEMLEKIAEVKARYEKKGRSGNVRRPRPFQSGRPRAGEEYAEHVLHSHSELCARRRRHDRRSHIPRPHSRG